VCADREGEPIALAFLPHGYNAFVLHYSVSGNSNKTFPAQLIQASMAMKHIKDHAEEYNIDPDKVFVTGFSAGGHLAASLGVLWNKKEIYDVLSMPYGYNKPAGMMLIYPVISTTPSYGHMGSFMNLLGCENPASEALDAVSIEKNITREACPAYVVHTSNDEIVNVKNSLSLANAYADAGMKFELHIYPDGPHGMALSNRITECGNARWVDECFGKWVENAVKWAEKAGI
jgi:acetyl esterase/lipase